MSTLVNNFGAVLRRPSLGFEYAEWTLRKVFGNGAPERAIHGVRLGNFNGFSEYHAIVQCVSPDEFQFIRTHDFGEGVMVDVGANLGLFSLLFSKSDPVRRIIAIEPNLSTYASLRNNVELNRARNIECQQIAIADHDGFVTFATREHARANASISNEAPPSQGGAVRVPSLTLDTFCLANKVNRIALLKVDVEGYEPFVFRGAKHILSVVRPNVIYFEVCPGLTRLAGFSPAEAASQICAHGYAIHRFGQDGQLERVKPEDASRVERVENWVGFGSL